MLGLRAVATWVRFLFPAPAVLVSSNYHLAGIVGYLLTDIFACYSPSIGRLKEKLMPLGYEFGLALQTVNIIRGIRKDYERGWVFVPVTFYEKFN